MKKILFTLLTILTVFSCSTATAYEKYSYEQYVNKKYNTKFSNSHVYSDDKYKFEKTLYDDLNEEYVLSTNDYNNYILKYNDYILGLIKKDFVKENDDLLRNKEDKKEYLLVKDGTYELIRGDKKEILYPTKKEVVFAKKLYSIAGDVFSIYKLKDEKDVIIETEYFVERLYNQGKDKYKSFDGEIVLDLNEKKPLIILNKVKVPLYSEKIKYYTYMTEVDGKTAFVNIAKLKDKLLLKDRNIVKAYILRSDGTYYNKDSEIKIVPDFDNGEFYMVNKYGATFRFTEIRY